MELQIFHNILINKYNNIYMGKSGTLGAGNAGASRYIKLNGNVGGGTKKKQGLVPLTNKSSRLYTAMFRAHPYTPTPPTQSATS